MTRQLGLRIGRWLKDRLLSSGRAVCELFYPRICTVCGESLMKGEVYLCTACLADFPFSDQAYAIQEDVLLNFDAASLSFRVPICLISAYIGWKA